MLLFSRRPGNERLVGTHVVKEEISKPVLFFSPFFFSLPSRANAKRIFPHSCSFPQLLLLVAFSCFANFCLNLEREDADLSLMGPYWSGSPLNLREFISMIALTMTAGSALLRKITASLALSANMQRSVEPSEPQIESDRTQHQHQEHSQ